MLNNSRLLNNGKIDVVSDENFIFNTSMCNYYKSEQGFDILKELNEKEEIEFPIAYAILTYHHAEQIDRLLRMIWRPQNHYCIHVDRKSSESFKKAIDSISNYFNNVFIPTKKNN